MLPADSSGPNPAERNSSNSTLLELASSEIGRIQWTDLFPHCLKLAILKGTYSLSDADLKLRNIYSKLKEGERSTAVNHDVAKLNDFTGYISKQMENNKIESSSVMNDCGLSNSVIQGWQQYCKLSKSIQSVVGDGAAHVNGEVWTEVENAEASLTSSMKDLQELLLPDDDED